MTVASPILVPPAPVQRLFSVDEYERMVRLGILTEEDDVELLQGRIITKMSRNPPHDTTLVLLLQLLSGLLPAGWHIRPQAAIRTATSQPEPDLAVVRGEVLDYSRAHPAAGDVALVIEIADTSLHHDRNVKGPAYAEASIPCYWIVNLSERRIEVYSNPTGPGDKPVYHIRRDVDTEKSVTLAVPGTAALEIPVAQIIRV